MSHFDSCQLTLIWLVRVTLNWRFISFSFLCWCDILYQLICRENDWSFIWAREMVMWLLSADVWFWQLPIHPHTDGLQSVNFSKMWHLTSPYTKCVCGWAYAKSWPNFLWWIVYQIFLPMALRKRALRARESSPIMILWREALIQKHKFHVAGNKLVA